MFSSLSFLESRAIPTNYTQAFSLAPSGNWDGNDGAWSTFMIRVGTPAQFFRVLPSTSGTETWIPIPDSCNAGSSWCGNARGVEPFNGAGASPFSGTPNGITVSTVDAGVTCTANKSPMCVDCLSINGRCTNGPCTGRLCCGDPPGACNSQSCNGLNGICTGTYIGCPCSGVDYNAPSNVTLNDDRENALAASGYQANQSSTWTTVGSYQLMAESYLDVVSSAQYGLDTVGLGVEATTGLTLNQNVIAGVLTEPFYLGQMGLKPSNTTIVNGTSSFMAQLKSEKLIPSLSYGYTAGAIYHQQPILGSLTFGGYDSSRFVPTTADFPLAGNDSRSLMIGIESITASGTLASNVTFLSNDIVALIDTTLPYIWLPLQACQEFETAFGLSWDASTEMYLVNDTIHQQLQNLNPSVTFTLGNSSANQSINITLPYGAFDLQASNPIYPNGTNYFPLRRASNSDQYTLGRAFFQEAYLFVDFERGNFSVSQALSPANSAPNIVTIDHSPPPPDSATNTNTSPNTTPTSHTKHDLSAGAIAGIAIGTSTLFILLFILLISLLRHHHHHHDRQSSSHQRKSHPPDLPSNEKESWPSSAETSPRHFSASETGTSNTPHIRELEATPSARPPGEIGRSARQELAGSATAKELPPIPQAKMRHVSELAADELWVGLRDKGARSGEVKSGF